MTWPGIEPQSPRPLVNTLPLSQQAGLIIYSQFYFLKYSYQVQIIIWFQVFWSNTNNYMVSRNYFYLKICLHTVIWFQVSNCHHHVVPLARISLTLSGHFSLSFIASGRSSGLHPVSSYNCWMYVRAGCLAFAGHMWGSIGVHHLWARPCFYCNPEKTIIYLSNS